MSTVLMIGLSHVVALRNAQAARLAHGAATFNLLDLELFPKFNPLYRIVEGEICLHDEVEPALRRAIEEAAPQLIIGSFWSNQHFFMSTANLPRRFDFVLPAEPDLALDASAEIVPYDVVRHHIRLHCVFQVLATAAIQRLTRTPLYLMPAPPPIEDFRAIPKGSSSKAIDAMVAEHGPAPALLRYKFWRLVNAIHDEVAAATNVRVLPVPPETVQSNGFRRPEYYYTDWIHANARYGEFVLKQIDASRAQI